MCQGRARRVDAPGSADTPDLKKRLKMFKKMISQGKVEAELILMTGEEAEKNPAGLGREDPNGYNLER